MTVDITQWRPTDIAPNTVVVIKTTVANIHRVAQIAETLKADVDPTVRFLIMDQNTEMLELSEDMMNCAGWYRKEAVATVPME